MLAYCTPSSHAVDHFKCYKVKVTAGTPKFPKGVQVSVADQFTSPAKLFDRKKPKHLCTPADENGSGIKDTRRHLLCYQAKPAKGQPTHVKVTGVNTANEIGADVVTTVKEQELCIPSQKTP